MAKLAAEALVAKEARLAAQAVSDRRRAAERRRILAAGGAAAQDLLERETPGCCWPTGDVDILADPPVLEGEAAVCGRPMQDCGPYCAKHNRQLDRESAPAPPQFVSIEES